MNYMRCNRSKPGACRHLSFATNPVLSNFFIQFDIYSEGGFFRKL